ncbi:hypothetical protein TNCV_2698671 [Trichonephila clavipes]|nr:hypothetical protein TNCV_2698671 [Trichonephila clavipes]
MDSDIKDIINILEQLQCQDKARFRFPQCLCLVPRDETNCSGTFSRNNPVENLDKISECFFSKTRKRKSGLVGRIRLRQITSLD